MGSNNRREFLKLCLASAPALAFPRASAAMVAASLSAGPNPWRTPAHLDRFIDPLPLLRRLEPHGTRGPTLRCRIRMVEFRKQLHSQLPPATLWGYEGQYPGPIVEARQGQPIEMEWQNDLPRRHIFPIDPHIHGAMPPAPAVRTVPHLHGARTPSASDGLPEKWFTPGQSVLYHYPNEQQATTLWYHDHALGITRLNVYAGLSGLYLLRDRRELSMDLPSGDYEVPLILQDRTLDDQGQLVYAPTKEDGTLAPPGVWAPEFFGNLPVVNGAIYPYLEVEPRRYRIRILNSANSRFFHLYFNLARRPTDIPSLVSFHQIGSDGGFLAAPVAMNKLLLGPAERADLVVDFSGLSGRTITLANDAPSPYPGWAMLVAQHAPLNELMQFRVTRPLAPKSRAFSLPAAVPIPRFDPAQATKTRDFVLTERLDARGNSLGVFINNHGYDDPVTETPALDAMEKWRFINTTDDAHPMHLHLVQFQILERQGYDTAAFTRGKLQFVGSPRPPAPGEAGWKDTAVVNPNDVLTILVRFEGYTGRYVFHCHMLEHEDNDMMRPYEVVAAHPSVQ
ncbi:MAG TPA: multicopper oxidase [Acidobacteriaceae bacterium]|jgi:spore coat protein A, manganese oxidase|nr:multicopper oxidase [Acidobacteriaceae bacterium]